MKKLIRWLYITFFRKELAAIAKEVRSNRNRLADLHIHPNPDKNRELNKLLDRTDAQIDTLKTLDLLV